MTFTITEDGSCPMDVESYSYDSVSNIFIDDGGYQVLNIFNIITPNQLYLFKHHRKCMALRGIDGQYIELIWEGDGNL